MRRFALAAALANLAFANPVPEDPPSGIGTGVTIAIAPPGAVPSGCIANWDGQPFGIAAVNITGNRRDVAQPDTPQPTASAAYLSAGEEGAAAAAPSLETPNLPAATPAPVVGPGEGTGGEGAFTGGEGAGAGLGLEGAGTGSEGAGAGAGAVPEGAVGGEIVPADGPASIEVPAAKLGVAMAPTDTDTTITVRSTRTHTRTVTVNKSSVTASSVEAPPAPPAPPAPSVPSVQITPTPAVQNTPSPTAQAPPPPPAQAPPPPPPSPAATQKPASGGSGSIDLSAYAVGCKKGDSLALTLKDGVLKDSANRIGYIASNRQFQFDGPPQAGAQVTAGFSICSNGTLALGPTTVFYQCRSGNFYNLYDQNVARQCNPVYLQALALKQC